MTDIERLTQRISTLEGHLDWLGWSSEGIAEAKGEIKEARDKCLGLQEVIAVLSTHFLDNNGRLKEGVWSGEIPGPVLRTMTQCHAWVVCSPGGNAMAELVAKMQEPRKQEPRKQDLREYP